jgi:hypothetical protein
MKLRRDKTAREAGLEGSEVQDYLLVVGLDLWAIVYLSFHFYTFSAQYPGIIQPSIATSQP